jgi:hypothetical protein
MTQVNHLLNRRLEGFRPETMDDGAGGQTSALGFLDNFDAKVDQPSASEMLVADQWESRHTHNLYFNSDALISRNDHFQGSDENGALQQFRVMSVVRPSRTNVYTKGIATLQQFEIVSDDDS